MANLEKIDQSPKYRYTQRVEPKFVAFEYTDWRPGRAADTHHIELLAMGISISNLSSPCMSYLCRT